MSEPVVPVDLRKVRTYPLSERRNKVNLSCFAKPIDHAAPVGSFLEGLPDILAVRQLRGLAGAIVHARGRARPVALALGAHVVKVGLSPVLLQLMEAGVVTALAMNGAGAIHDWEIASIGATSEDVAESLHAGRFGMAEETGRELNEAAAEAWDRGEGFGETLGRRIVRAERPHRAMSLLGRAWELGIPVTVHVAIGSDIVHQHPRANGAAIGEASFTDFRRLVSVVMGLAGGVWINCGSAVQLPEVFLKALSVAENLSGPIADLTTANLDMIRHYRTEENVLRRPSSAGGRFFSLVGHHEILVPLLAAAVAAMRTAGPGASAP